MQRFPTVLVRHFALLVLLFASAATLAAEPPAFPGQRSVWNGFDRFDFQVDGKAALVVAPQQPAAGRPWVWHGEFFGHKPEPDIALLKRGFHVVYLRVPDMLGSPQAVEHWNAFYKVLTEKYGFAKKAALVGLSRGGLYCYNWAAANPDKVACIYGDAPVCDFKSWPGGKGKGKGSPRDWKLVLERYGFKDDAEAIAYAKNPVDNLAPLAKEKVPLLHVYGDADDVVPWDENTGLIAERYRKLGGSITLIGKPGVGHHPHGLNDPTPIVEFIARHAAVAKAGRRPNVLVILTDDMRWDAMSGVGHPWFKTPHLDRLAAEGARFANAFVTTSLCSPSRASLLSGRYACRHKVLNNFTDFPNDLPSYPRRLRESGYETAYIGKWHMGERSDEQRPGFDHWMSHKGQGNYWDTEFNINGERRVLKGYYTHVVTDAAVQWLERSHDRPWLMVLGHKAPHGGPIVPEPKYEHAFDDVAIAKPKNFENYRAADGKPAWLEQQFSTWHGAGGPLYNLRDYGKFVRAYHGTLASVDDSVGRIYQTLRRSGQLDDTLIVFTSDNGFALGEHGRVDKRTMYDESLRVPLVVRYPRLVRPGQSITPMVLNLDLAPSVLDICGAAPLPEIDGRSWKPLLAGERVEWRRSWLYEYNYEREFPYTPNVRGVRTDEWKLIRYPHGDGTADRHRGELYNLRADPLETRNLIDDPDSAAKREELTRELDRLLRELPSSQQLVVDEGIQNVPPRY